MSLQLVFAELKGILEISLLCSHSRSVLLLCSAAFCPLSIPLTLSFLHHRLRGLQFDDQLTLAVSFLLQPRLMPLLHFHGFPLCGLSDRLHLIYCGLPQLALICVCCSKAFVCLLKLYFQGCHLSAMQLSSMLKATQFGPLGL